MRKKRPSAFLSVPMVLASSALALSALGVQLAQSAGSSSASKTSKKGNQAARASAAVVPNDVAALAPPPTTTPPPPPPTTTTSPPPTSTTTTTTKPASAVAATSSVAGGVWAQLRQCESSGNYQENTGNGFYGAYQFTLQTWSSLGLSGLPSQAAPAVQDDAAKRLQARDGWGSWPACSRKLGLS